jgi:hypothetical protein
LRSVGRLQRQQPVDDRQEEQRTVAPLQCEADAVALVAAARCRRRLADDHQVQDGAQRIEVGPGPALELLVLAVHLQRCIAVARPDRTGLAARRTDPTCCAQVHQQGSAVGLDHDVLRRNVAVLQAGAVQVLQRAQQGVEQ